MNPHEISKCASPPYRLDIDYPNNFLKAFVHRPTAGELFQGEQSSGATYFFPPPALKDSFFFLKSETVDISTAISSFQVTKSILPSEKCSKATLKDDQTAEWILQGGEDRVVLQSLHKEKDRFTRRDRGSPGNVIAKQ